MDLRLAAAPLAALAASVPVPALAQAGQTVAEVKVNGLSKTNEFVVLSAATLKSGVAFTNEAFEADKARIRDLGLYASVSGRTETTPDGRLRVIYDVVENPVITNIVLTGNKALKTEELRALVSSKPGEVLNTAVVDQDVQRIQRLYTDRGYIAFVSDQIGIDPKTGVLTIPVVETVVESVRITGNKKTKPFVITREMKTRPGEPFNSQVLRRDLSRVYNLGIFEDFGNVQTEPGSDVGRVNVILPVQERRTGQVSVGFGYSTRQRLVGTLALSESNFRGRGQGVSFEWTVGGVAARNSFELGFSTPWIGRNNTSLSASLYDRVLYRFTRTFSTNATDRQDDDPYFERRRGGSVTVARPLAETSRAYVTVRTESIQANNLQENYSNFTNDEINRLRTSLVQSGNVSSVTPRMTVNTRDNDLDPASGVFFSPSVELGTSSFDYDNPRVNPAWVGPTETPNVPRILVDKRTQSGSFAKYNLDLRSYLSLNGPRRPGSITEPKRVLAGRVLFGLAQGTIGFSEQYFLGGAETLRGFPDDRFWGNRLFLASAELRLPLDNRGTVTGVLFTDVGDAWGAPPENREDIPDFEQHSGFRPNVGAGLGLRLRTPIGPVRLDYGFSREGGRTHFSIGQAF